MRALVSRTILVVLLATVATNSAFAKCGKHTYRGLFGKCFPEVGGSVGQGAEHIKGEIQAQTLGPLLETWINQSRNTAQNGAQPIPPQIREALTGYIDEDSMNRARFKIGDRGVLNLAGLSIKYGDFVGGDAAAVTLNDIIVFADANNAFNNPALWAHELTHVQQFKIGNVHDFSIAYARSSASMEGPAYAKGNNFWNWYDAHNQPGDPRAQQSTQLYWIGVAGNQFGAVATRTGANLADAQALALDACNQIEGGGCANGSKPIPGDRFMCYAIYRDGNILYESLDPNPALALANTLQDCQNSSNPGPGCELLISSCNDRP